MITRTRPDQSARASTSPNAAPRRGPGRKAERVLTCSFCGRDGAQVRFAVIDPEHVNVCEPCMGECVRQYAITCVC